jgi:hypothetical protein
MSNKNLLALELGNKYLNEDDKSCWLTKKEADGFLRPPPG